MRSTLETHIRCAQCGTNLELCYEDKARKAIQRGTLASNITGADKVEHSVFVEPCKTCLEPLKRLQQALKVLNLEQGI